MSDTPQPAVAAPVEAVAAPLVDAEKTPAADAGASETLEADLIRQIEFYLSDSNLPFDKFLFALWSASCHSPAQVVLDTPVPADLPKTTLHADSSSKLDPFYLGWIPLAKLVSFKRMQPFLQPAPAGFGTIEAMVPVLQAGSKLVEVRPFGAEGAEGAGFYVRRSTNLSRPEDAMERSVYIKGFPMTEGEATNEAEKEVEKAFEDALQIKLEAWIRSFPVKVKSLRMRRTNPTMVAGKPVKGLGRNKYKGSVFVELSSAADVATFLALDPKPTYEGAELLVMSKAAYVEMKFKIYDPEGKGRPATPAVPANPYAKNGKDSKGKPNNNKPFNAWAEGSIGVGGFPRAPGADRRDTKRKATEEADIKEREILFNGVTFTARKGDYGKIEIVDEATVGTGAGGWEGQKVLRFTISKKDGTMEGTEAGEYFNHGQLKTQLYPICKPAFVAIITDDAPEAKAPAAPSEFPPRLDAPPTVVSAASIVPATTTPALSGGQEYPAKGQASFRDVVTDEIFETLKTKLGTWEGRTLTWVRATDAEEREHVVGRARFHAEQAFSGDRPDYGNKGGRGGGRGGRGGDRGGRGGRGGGRGGDRGRGGRGGGDRAKRPRTD